MVKKAILYVVVFALGFLLAWGLMRDSAFQRGCERLGGEAVRGECVAVVRVADR